MWRHHSTLTTETITELNFREPPHEFGSQLREAGGELHESASYTRSLHDRHDGPVSEPDPEARERRVQEAGNQAATRTAESSRLNGPTLKGGAMWWRKKTGDAPKRELRPAHLLRWLLGSAPL